MHCESIDPHFWEDFAKKIWEKESFCSNSVFQKPPITDHEIFEAFCKALEEDQLWYTPVTLYIDGNTQKFTLENEFYPTRTDGSFSGYHERLTKKMNVKEYCLLLQQLHIADFALWEWCKEFLAGLYRNIGFNKLGNTTSIFIGNYTSTPFGVHADPESVFQIPIKGKKRIRAWTSEYQKQHKGLSGVKTYPNFMDGSIKIEAEPGGFLYWPSEYWHIGEKADDFNITLAIGLGCTRNIMKPLLHRIVDLTMKRDELTTDMIVPMDIDNIDVAANNLPADISIASDFIAEIFSRKVLHEIWIKLVTGAGFLSSPKPLPILPHDKTVIFNSQKYPIVYVKLGDKLVMSVNGHLSEFDYNEQLIEMIAAINHNTTIDVQFLIETYKTLTKNNIINIVNWLESLRAITTM